MNVWLITVGEPLPTDAGNDRLWRTGLLARSLCERGHDVVWWSSAFDHFKHVARSPVDVPVRVSDRFTVWHLSGASYRKNASFARMLNHYQVARQFRQRAESQPKPDVILSSLPTLELCDAAVNYGAAHDVPVALDIRDLWPDVLFDLVPAPLRGLARAGVPWMTRQLRDSMLGATAVLGVTDEFLAWGRESSGRVTSGLDRAFPMAYSARVPTEVEQREAADLWIARGVNGAERPVFCFFGTLGWMFDFDTVLAAASALEKSAPQMQFVFCGGNQVESLRQRARGLTNIVLPGHVGAPEIWTLMRQSVAGLAPYQPLRNFEDNLPNKPIEYLSAGLPVVATDLAVLGRLLREEQCGLSYRAGDAEGLAAALLSLVRDPAERARMSARASKVYADRFVAERVYDDMAAHLEAIARA